MPDRLTAEQLAEIRQRCEAATPTKYCPCGAVGFRCQCSSRTDVPLLLAEIDVLTAERRADAAERELAEWRRYGE